MNEPTSGADMDLILAYLRGELSTAQQHGFAARLREDAALRDELAWMRAVADIETRRYVAETAEDAFATLQSQLGPLPRPATASGWQRLLDWFDAHSRVLQPALVAVLIAQAGVIGMMVKRNDIAAVATLTSGQTAAPAGSVWRGPALSCLSVWLDIDDATTVGQLRRWMALYGGSFAEGPDANGRVRILFDNAEDLQVALHDPTVKSLTRHISAPAGCATQ